MNGTPQNLTGHLSEVALACQRTLSNNPCHPEALIGVSLVALASNQIEAAVKTATAAVAAAPAMVVAWVALGQALKAADRLAEARQACTQALQLDGTNALAHLGLGELYLACEHIEDAIAEFNCALIRQPNLAAAHLGLGNAHAILKRNAEALAHYDRALTLHPRMPEAEFAAGFILARMGSIDEAETRYRRAIAARPDFAAAWVNLGSLLRDRGHEVMAEAALRRAASLRPGLVSAWINLAALERDRNRAAEAERHLRTALDLNPNQVEALIAWCQFCVHQHDLPAAWQWLNRALAIDPRQNEAMNMKGILLHSEGRCAEAVAAFEQAEKFGSHSAASNRGNSLLDLGCIGEALRAHQSAVDRDPAHAGAAYNLALTQLRLGDWTSGWRNYEARWRFREVHHSPRIFRQPRWRGEQLHGRRILLHAEQGLGDTIQFCRFAGLVAAHGGHVILQVQPPVERLLHSLEVARSGRAEVALLGVEPPAFDLECPLMSLPAVFGTTIETVPSTCPYLYAGREAARQKLTDFHSVHPGPRIGLAWAGNPRYKADRARSMRLETLAPLLRTIPANWISLQKGEAAHQLAALPADISVLDGSSHDRDLADTAALLATLDLVLTTDTSIAHLAGAMAIPVWIVLPHLADWRWMQSIATTPWYPSARLFRQSVPGDWQGVFDRVIAQLAHFSTANPRDRSELASIND